MSQTADAGAIVCLGEILIRLGTPAGRQIADAQRLELVVGGAEANVAVALRALGLTTRMCSGLPDNPLGARALSALAASDVDTRHVLRAPGRMGLYFLEGGGSLRPATVVYDRAASMFAGMTADQIDFDAVFDGARLLHLSGITAALGPNGLALSHAAIAAARRAGMTISFDCNFRETLWNAWNSNPGPDLHALISQVDILFANHRDMTLVLGGTFSGESRNDDAADAAFAAFPKLELMASTARKVSSATHHHLSARVDLRGHRHVTEEIAIPDIVDRVGTGDAFAAGVLFGWAEGRDAREMAESGLSLCALKHAIHGDFCRIGRAELSGFKRGESDIVR